MVVEIIKTKKQYLEAIARFEEIFLAKSNTKEGKEAQLLALVIKDYEDKNYKEAIKILQKLYDNNGSQDVLQLIEQLKSLLK